MIMCSHRPRLHIRLNYSHLAIFSAHQILYSMSTYSTFLPLPDLFSLLPAPTQKSILLQASGESVLFTVCCQT